MEENHVKLVDETEASEILAVTKAALRRWRRERRGPRFVKLGRLIRYSQTDLESFVERSTQNVLQDKRKFAALSS
jgi:predicted DNA-binding transcriptional regulator AlpA